MDRRSWPWKKKSSSDKAAAEKAAAILDSAGSQPDQEKYKKPNYVQISVESYSHLTGLEEQVKMYEDTVKNYEDRVQSLDNQINDLNEKLSAAQSEMTTKENLVKQHAKVAEDAISGWEKAEAEAAALKTHLESVTLSKLTAEDRASHLDGALKECMRQIRNLKEEHEQKLQDVVLTKNKQCENMKLELEANISNLEQELLRCEAENSAMSRSLHERSNMLMKISEEKAQAEADIELLKSNLESCDREINSLKYELHVASKELEIRNEEKNMSVKSAEVANKQHMEGVKKIAKLEAECQRLRGLVRKKLPGPAALAQMKLEVESLGRDYGETRTKRSPVKPSSPHFSPGNEFSLDKLHKENSFLTERLFAMEEETKMLKEALAKRNSELQASRNLCAKTGSKLQSLEAQMQINNQQRNHLKFNIQVGTDGSVVHNASNPPSLTSVSEDGNDDVVSCAESWSTTLISEHSQMKKDKNTEKLSNTGSTNNLELMDDFLEMEKLACLPNDSNGVISASDNLNKNATTTLNFDASGAVSSEQQEDLPAPQTQADNQLNCDVESLPTNPGSGVVKLPEENLQLRISSLLEAISKNTDMSNIVADIKQVLKEAHDTLHWYSVSSISNEKHCSESACDRKSCPADATSTADKEISLFQDSEPATQSVHLLSRDLTDAVSKIHEFVRFLGKEANAVHQTSHDDDYLSQKIEECSMTFGKLVHNDTNLDKFVLDLSHVLSKACELRFNILGCKGTDSEASSPACIDKVALPENRVVSKDSSSEVYLNDCAHISDPEVPDDGNLGMGYESNTRSCRFSMEDFEQLKSERDGMANDLAKYTESLETTKSQLHETEQLLAEAKSQLASAQKSNSLAETQLRCMAESYRSLERRAEELETELNLLRTKTDSLENELQEEKNNHQDTVTRCKDLEEKLQRNESCPTCAPASADDADIKAKQEKELAAAAEKLAECQETIFLLGKQLKSFRPPSEFMGSPYSQRSQKGDDFTEEELTDNSNMQEYNQADVESAASTNNQKVVTESLSNTNTAPSSPNNAEAKEVPVSPVSLKQPKHRHSKSSSSSSNGPTPEKQARGFSRFFSSKGKGGH